VPDAPVDGTRERSAAPTDVAIVLTVLATNFSSDGLRDALNPRIQIGERRTPQDW
jgi:hypothetical protein